MSIGKAHNFALLAQKMSDSPNRRLKSFLESLNKTYDEIAQDTGIPRRTWQRQIEEGASIKSDYLIKLGDVYGADIAYILTGKITESAKKDTTDQAPPVINDEEFPYLAQVNFEKLSPDYQAAYIAIVRLLRHLRTTDLPVPVKTEIIDSLLDDIDKLSQRKD